MLFHAWNFIFLLWVKVSSVATWGLGESEKNHCLHSYQLPLYYGIGNTKREGYFLGYFSCFYFGFWNLHPSYLAVTKAI